MGATKTADMPAKFAEPSMDLWCGDFHVSDEPLKSFYRLLDEDFNLRLYFDPITINNLSDAKQATARVPFIYSVINKKAAKPELINVGVAGILKYERLRCGWHLFVAVENKFRKLAGGEASIREFYKRAINFYFTHFTERYLYLEFLEEYRSEIENVESLGGEYMGKSRIFKTGNEVTTAIYGISRETIDGLNLRC